MVLACVPTFSQTWGGENVSHQIDRVKKGQESESVEELVTS